MADDTNRGALAKILVVGMALLLSAAPAAGLTVGFSGTGFLGSTHQQADAGPTEIGSCTVIDEPGSYVLTEDIEDSEADVCVDIQSSDVRFDGNGHTIDGNLSRETIENASQGPAPRTRVGVGVNAQQGTEERIENVTTEDFTTRNWFHGVLAENTSDSRTSGATAYDNGGGIVYDNSSGVTVDDSNSSNNVILGVIADSRAGFPNADNRIVDNTAQGNGFFGVAMFLSNNSTVEDNTITENTFGIFAYGTSNSTFADNDAQNNSAVGFALEGDLEPTPEEPVNDTEPRVPEVNVSKNNVVSGNDFSESGSIGIGVLGPSETYIANNDVSNIPGTAPFPTGYPSSGLLFDNASNNTIENTTATNQADQAYVSLNNSTDNAVDTLVTDTATVSFESKDVMVGATDSPSEDPENRTNIGQYVNATNTSDDSFLDLDVHYEDSDVEEAGVDESTLGLFEFADGEWAEVEGSSVDTDVNVVSGNVTTFANESVLAPLGQQTGEAPTDGEQPPSEKPAEPQQPEPGVTYYQIDFVEGEPIESLDWPDGTYTNDQLIRFAHGSTEEPITRRSEGEFTTDEALAERIESQDIEVANGTANVTFTVADGEAVTLSLASYTKPDPTWDPEDEDDQVFVDAQTETYDSGTHTLTVDLPDGSDTEESDESGGSDGTTESEASATGEGEFSLAGLQADADGTDANNLNDEFLTYENTGDAPLDLSGWTVEDSSGTTYTFPDGFTLEPGEQATLYTGSGSDTDAELYWGQASEVWNNGADSMTVRNAKGETVLQRSYP